MEFRFIARHGLATLSTVWDSLKIRLSFFIASLNANKSYLVFTLFTFDQDEYYLFTVYRFVCANTNVILFLDLSFLTVAFVVFCLVTVTLLLFFLNFLSEEYWIWLSLNATYFCPSNGKFLFAFTEFFNRRLFRLNCLSVLSCARFCCRLSCWRSCCRFARLCCRFAVLNLVLLCTLTITLTLL